MKRMFGDLWTLAEQEAALGAVVAVCITTNGDVTRAGRAAMGRGVALEAKQKFARDGLDARLGWMLGSAGNRVYPLAVGGPYDLFSFPVKHHWREKADLDLIEKSAHELDFFVTRGGYDVVLLPRPGCGNGGLDWVDVKPRIDFLDDRYYEVTK